MRILTIRVEAEVAEYAAECVEKARERALKAIGASESRTVQRARRREVDLGAAFIEAVAAGTTSAETPGGASLTGEVP